MSESIIILDEPKKNKDAKISKLFNAIKEFTEQLNDVFGKEDVNVNKVYRIIWKTSMSNQKVVKSHVTMFHDFVTKNYNQIINKEYQSFTVSSIQLTDRIGMDLSAILSKADESNRLIIWQHLYNIIFLFNPDDLVVKEKLNSAVNKSPESEFLGDTFKKFEEVMKSSEASGQKDPMAMMSGLLQSGFLNDMIGNINNGVNKGDLNIKSLINNVQGLLTNLSKTIDDENK
jgi:hypothetical protein